MAKVYRKNPHLLSYELFDNDGGAVTLYLRRPDTPTILSLTSSMMALQRAVSPDKGGLDAEAYAATVPVLGELVVRADGLTDEEDAPLLWHDLTAEEREELLLNLRVEDVMKTFTALMRVGRLKTDEKKSSETTSRPSTPAAPADAPAAPEE